MASCDSCGVPVSTKGYLGGGIVCKECAEAKAKGDEETLEKRRAKYSS